MKKITLILPVLLIALSACDNPYVPPTPDPETFEVTFCNYDESVLYVDVVEKGEDALYEGETPTRPDDSNILTLLVVGTMNFLTSKKISLHSQLTLEVRLEGEEETFRHLLHLNRVN